MIYYEYDNKGFLVGWHEEDGRANSTTIEPTGILPGRAKWDGSAWVEDTSKESEAAQLELAAKTKKTAALNLLSTFNPETASTKEIKDTLAAVIEVLKNNGIIW